MTQDASTVPYVSLFSGALGLDLGLEHAGFCPAVLNENDSASVKTIRRNRPHYRVSDESLFEVSAQDLQDLAGVDLHGIPFIAGGPPCQAFSVMGRRQGLEDERGTLIYEFLRVVRELRPKTFLMENVRGLLSMSLIPASSSASGIDQWKKDQGSLYTEVVRRFEEIGYRLDCFVVNSANYGAPQVRERVIIIGNRHDVVAEFAPVAHSNREEDLLPPFMTLREVIGEGFEDPDPTLMNFSPRKLRYLALVPPGGNWRSLPEDLQREAMGKQYYLKGGRSSSWRRLSWDYPSPTIHTLPNHATTSMCHPGDLRALTVGECAAIQEFPPGYEFVGSPSERYRQIGNAVPVRLGHVAGQAVRVLLQSISELPDAEKKASIKRPTVPSRIVHLRPHVRVRSWYKDGQALAGDFGYGRSVNKREDRQMALDLDADGEPSSVNFAHKA